MRAILIALAVSPLGLTVGHAEHRYGPGVTNTEIKLGQTMPYSGPASPLGTIGRAQLAYFQKINSEGGVNGRKIRLISLDDAFNPAKTVEQTRKMIEGEEVLALFNSLGPGQLAVQKYVNQKKVPHLFVGSGAREWDDPAHFPWSMGFQPAFESEGRLFAQYVLKHHPNAKIGVIAVNNDLGQNAVRGLKQGLGKVAETKLIVASIEFTDPTVDSQLIALRVAGAEVLMIWATPRASTQTMRKLHDMDWHPVYLLSVVNSSIKAVLEPGGLENAVGIVSSGFLKQPSDPTWKDEPGMQNYLAWIKDFYPDGDSADLFNVYGYTIAQAMVEVLQRCGDDLTRENLMRQATSLRDLELPLLLPGIKVNTSPTKYRPVDELQLLRFDGARWVPFGEVSKP